MTGTAAEVTPVVEPTTAESAPASQDRSTLKLLQVFRTHCTAANPATQPALPGLSKSRGTFTPRPALVGSGDSHENVNRRHHRNPGSSWSNRTASATRACRPCSRKGRSRLRFRPQMVTGDQQAPVSLSDFHGRKVILYSIPRTSRRMPERGVRVSRRLLALSNAGLTVLGCSVDSADAHKSSFKNIICRFRCCLDSRQEIATAYARELEFRCSGSTGESLTSSMRKDTCSSAIPNVDPSTHATRNPERPGRRRRTLSGQAASPTPAPN